MSREFRAVCRSCDKEMSWRESYERAERDRSDHRDLCSGVFAAGGYDHAIEHEPDVTFQTREVRHD